MFGKPMAWLLSGSVLAAVTVLSCGKNVCFMGQGDCAQDLTSTTLALKASATTVNVGATLTFTPSGGTKPYTGYNVINTPPCGSVNPGSGDATTFSATVAGNCCVRVTDTGNNTADRCVIVQ